MSHIIFVLSVSVTGAIVLVLRLPGWTGLVMVSLLFVGSMFVYSFLRDLTA
jgi:hypothetical protein